MTNKDYIKKYKDKKVLEPVLFSKPEGKNQIPIEDIVTPLKLDLRQFVSPTDNQFDTPHCAAFSAAQVIESLYWKETGKLLEIDAAHIYAKAKEADGMVEVNGTYPELTLRAGLDMATFLSDKNYTVKKYYNQKNDKTIETLKRLIHKNGLMIGGFQITKDWYSILPGNSFLERPKSKVNEGGHAVTVCGYLPDALIIQNSWGKGWGAKGFAKLGWKVVLDQLMYVAYLERK